MSLKNSPTANVKGKLNEQAEARMSGLRAISHKPIPLLLGLLTAWIIGGAWLYRIVCCTSPATLSPLLIQDGAIPVASAPENLRFLKGEAIPLITSPTIESELQKAAQYVAERPDKVLAITGRYNTNELAEGDDTNLGEARAASMKEKFISWGIDKDYILTSGKSSPLIRPIRDTIYGGVGFKVRTIPNRFLSFSTPDGFEASAKDNVAFGPNGATLGTDVPDDVKMAAQQLAAHLKANPDKMLQINGWYGNDETYNGDAANLGEARANALKDWYIKMGVPANQIAITATPKDDLIFIGDKLYSGADYVLGSAAEIADANADNVANSLSNSKNNIAFTPDSYDVGDMSAEMKTKAADFAAYLKANPNKRLRISGLFDSDETYSGNFANLGEARANAIKNWMISMGVPEGQIVIDGKNRADIDGEIVGGAIYRIEDNPDYKGEVADNTNTSDANTSTNTGTNTTASNNTNTTASGTPPPAVIIYFDYNSATPKISATDREKLLAFAKYLAANNGAKAVAEGHTDNVGSASYNITLSKQRSIAIENFLAQQGASKGQVDTQGFGFKNPVAANDSETTRAKNRRVELKIKN